MAYRTDLDLRRLFTQLPRSDDGTPVELPSIIPDTIQPTVELFPSGADVSIAALPIERINVNTAAPTGTTGTITVPVGERWVMWRAVLSHSDPGGNRDIAVRVQQPGVGSAALAIKTSFSAPTTFQVVVDRPMVLQPLAVVDGITGVLTVIAGVFGLNIVITRLALTDTIPQVPLGF